MSLNLLAKDRYFDQTVADYVATVVGELPGDAVGLWQIVPMGRHGFRLDQADLDEFVSRCIRALLDNGAKPVKGGGGTAFDWISQQTYGVTNDEILLAVMQEWRDGGSSDCDVDGLWFALPGEGVGHE